MTEFPELEKVSPRGIRKWAAKIKAWANAKGLVAEKDSGIKLQEFPTGTLISIDFGGNGTAGGGFTKLNLYYIDGGILKAADFPASNITTV